MITENIVYKRFMRQDFREDVKILRVESPGTVSNALIESELYQKLQEHISIGTQLWAVIISPTWRLDTKINRYYSLAKWLSKDYEVSGISFLIDDIIECENQIFNIGIVPVMRENFSALFKCATIIENIIFVSGNPHDLIEMIKTKIIFQDLQISMFMDIPKMVNLLIDHAENIATISGWIEMNQYYLDFYTKK